MWGWIAAIVWLLIVIGAAGDSIGWIVLLMITPYIAGLMQRGDEKGSAIAAGVIGVPIYLFGMWQLIVNVWGNNPNMWGQITGVLVLIVLVPVTAAIGIVLFLMGADTL